MQQCRILVDMVIWVLSLLLQFRSFDGKIKT